MMKGKSSVKPHVFASGNFPIVNSRLSVESNPIGGGSLAPVAKTRTSSSVALDSLSVNTVLFINTVPNACQLYI